MTVLALFISDLHLQPSHPHNAEAFHRFLAERAMGAQSLYLLGDLFEYWAGDDDIAEPFNQSIIAAIRAVSDAGVKVYWIAGNRDFLVGSAFAEAAGVTLLQEPHVADIGGRRVTLVHGDAECTLDTKYMEFRAQVRHPAWQQQFLSMPLAQRKAIIAGLREGSKEAHGTKSYEIMDVTPEAVGALFVRTGSDVIIHGHTHRPALHDHGDGRRRFVLPDWEVDAHPPRGGWISIDSDGVIRRHGVDGEVLD
ncbi:UDP-2,3-diacylglucosamine diphosphatase [Massilia cavernae]|uniref:UDP-2,3-diacylglucosamine hydrolase n=1 Tax=Massilia cavernae TaxID=2320864 RepID=A0A418XE42_9BURK|nr:UDP-2,3-diacylglucosamine diphosphatase [Massilia cavernae]RJG10786.1 UDP-2,3-diacylglucosamine diphosphatase [Massilia cavernae]